MHYPIMMNYDNTLNLLLLQDPAILAPEEIVSNKVLTLYHPKERDDPLEASPPFICLWVEQQLTY